MSTGVRVRVRPAPHIGVRVPGWALRAVIAVVGIGLCFGQLPDGFAGGFWFWFGIVLAVTATVFPTTPAAWALMVLLGASVLVRVPSPVDPRLYLLIAGIHLLQLLAAYARVVPAAGRVQLQAFSAPIRRYIIVQLPTQLVAAIVLFAFAPAANRQWPTIPVLGVVAGAALVALTLVFIVPLIRSQRGGVR